MRRCARPRLRVVVAMMVVALAGGARCLDDSALPRSSVAPAVATRRDDASTTLAPSPRFAPVLPAPWSIDDYMRERMARRCGRAPAGTEVWLGSGDAIGGNGEIDERAVARKLRSALPGLRRCFGRGLRDRPASPMQVEVRFTVGEGGRPIRIGQSGAAESRIGACFLRGVQALLFPVPEGGTVDFSFPFMVCPASATARGEAVEPVEPPPER